jgi:hypothetical protein
LQEINNLEDDSDEIYASGLIKCYTKRPAKLEDVSLADWAAWYNSSGKPYLKSSHELDIDNYDNNEEEESKPKNKKRSKARVIRSVCFNKEVDSEKHYRELIMLFSSWRDEITDLLGNCTTLGLEN